MTITAEKPTHAYTLDNGLQVILRQDHRTPGICASLFHKAGTDHEHANQRGLAYLAGGATFKDKDLERKIGATANGWIDYHLSAYSLEALGAELATVLQLLAARMEPQTLSQERLDKGIKHTRKLEESEPYFSSDYWITSTFEELIFPQARTVYKFGNVDDLARITVADVLSWHEEGYAPNNSILVIAGDIALDDVQPLIQHLFADLAPFKGFAPAEQPAHSFSGDERRLVQHLDTPLPRLQMAFNTPSLATPGAIGDIRALQVISALLTKGPQAWLPLRLSEDKHTLSGVISRLPAYRRNDDLFLLAATLGVDTSLSVQQVELEIKQLLESLKTHALDAETLKYGQQQALESLEEQDTLEIQASILGNLAAIDLPWTLIDSEAGQIHSVTADDIQRVANTYFSPERLSVAHSLPREA